MPAVFAKLGLKNEPHAANTVSVAPSVRATRSKQPPVTWFGTHQIKAGTDLDRVAFRQDAMRGHIELYDKDDQLIRSLYATVLQRAGFDVLLAGDGMAGLETLETHEVGLVLCDVSMPDMSGFDVVRALRSSPRTATLPIILIAGAADQDSVIEGLSAGADDFLAKPARNAELVAKMVQARGLAAKLVAEERLRPAFLFEQCAVDRLDEAALRADPMLAALDPGLDSVVNVNEPADYQQARARPAPEVTIQRFGPLANGHRGPEQVLAATVAGAADAAGLTLDAHVVAALNGDQITRDGETPLAAGDSVFFLSADAGG